MINAVRLMLDDDLHVTYRQIEFSLGINSSTVYSILRNHLKLWKVCLRRVPHSLTNDQKGLRIQFCRESLKRSRRVFYIVTGDKSWFHHYDLETQQRSKTWVSKDDPHPTKVLSNFCFGKQMVAIFFMKSGWIEPIALKSGSSVSARSFVTNCQSRIFDAAAQRREKTGPRRMILHDDRARPHRTWMTTKYLAENRVALYQNLPYLSDLNLRHLFLFSKLKNQL